MSTCLAFNTDTCKSERFRQMLEARTDSAACVFLGRLVVSGGYLVENNRSLRTVETYDHAGDAWTRMPDMTHRRNSHGLVAVGSKLYAFGGGVQACEVYDCLSNSFSLLTSPLPRAFDNKFVEEFRGAVTIGSRIMVFFDCLENVAVFDFDANEWSEKEFGVTKNIKWFDCLKMPEIL